MGFEQPTVLERMLHAHQRARGEGACTSPEPVA
jgi:hypothetical protein